MKSKSRKHPRWLRRRRMGGMADAAPPAWKAALGLGLSAVVVWGTLRLVQPAMTRS